MGVNEYIIVASIAVVYLIPKKYNPKLTALPKEPNKKILKRPFLFTLIRYSCLSQSTKKYKIMLARTNLMYKKEKGEINCKVYLMITEAPPQMADTVIRARIGLRSLGIYKL